MKKKPHINYFPLITSHGRRRSQQRGKTRTALALVYRHGDLERRVGRGRLAIRLSRDICRALVSDGASPNDVDRAARIELIVSEADSAVVTVLNAECK